MSSLFYLARRFKTATALNLLGLTVAFAAFYLFMTQVLYNFRRLLPVHDAGAVQPQLQPRTY